MRNNVPGAISARGVLFYLSAGASACLIVVIAASLLSIGADASFITGAAAGCLLTVCKAAFWWNLPVKLARSENKRPVRSLIINVGVQLMTGAALCIAALLSARLFYGMAAGMLAAIAGVVAGTVMYSSGKP